MSLASSLSATQKRQLLILCDEAFSLGATRAHLAPIYGAMFLGNGCLTVEDIKWARQVVDVRAGLN